MRTRPPVCSNSKWKSFLALAQVMVEAIRQHMMRFLPQDQALERQVWMDVDIIDWMAANRWRRLLNACSAVKNAAYVLLSSRRQELEGGDRSLEGILENYSPGKFRRASVGLAIIPGEAHVELQSLQHKTCESAMSSSWHQEKVIPDHFRFYSMTWRCAQDMLTTNGNSHTIACPA